MSDLQGKILKILQNPGFHSGESLGRQLNVSRTAIWKQLQALETLGLELESVKGVGYRLPDSFELLSKAKILHHIAESHGDPPCELEIFQSIDSTKKSLRHIHWGNVTALNTVPQLRHGKLSQILVWHVYPIATVSVGMEFEPGWMPTVSA